MDMANVMPQLKNVLAEKDGQVEGARLQIVLVHQIVSIEDTVIQLLTLQNAIIASKDGWGHPVMTLVFTAPRFR